MDSLLNSLKQFCLSHPSTQIYWVGLSGGLDSCVLLHMMSCLRDEMGFRFNAIHVNHGLSPHADVWQAQCEAFCQHLEINYFAQKVIIQSKSDDSPEDQARQLRYGVFARLMQAGDMLLTAHQQDDQAETVFLQLLRGAGPKGLAAMPRSKKFSKGWHARPLLDYTRADLTQYAHDNKLMWIEDESNQDTHFPRNFLRQTIFPLLKTRWPSVTKTIARVADHCATSQAWIDEVAAKELAEVRGQVADTICSQKLLSKSPVKQQFILRAWFAEREVPVPPLSKIITIQKNLLLASVDKSPCVVWADVVLRRFQEQLYILRAQAHLETEIIVTWDLRQPLLIPGLGTLQANSLCGKGLIINEATVTVRFRQGGEVIHTRGHHHTLKSLLHAWRIPPWERDRIPLLYVGDKLVAIVGYCIADGLKAKTDQWGWNINIKQKTRQISDKQEELLRSK